MGCHKRKSVTYRPSLEELESRAVPASSPWPDSTHLTLSFAPDGTSILGHSSNLFQTAEQQHQDSQAWERAILEAFQTWAVKTNVSIGVVEDAGQPFGVSGLIQGDHRFGDIRIGAMPLPNDVLSLSVPSDPTFSGTWAGDIIFNSNLVNNQNLFAVALHEAGHSFGLPESADPRSPMFGQLGNRTQLTAADISTIQSMYGLPPGDTAANNSISTATVLSFPTSTYQGDTPLMAFGDISTLSDVDYYALNPLSNYTGPVTFQLYSRGMSLLSPKLSIYDQFGNLLGQAQSINTVGDIVTVHLNQVDPNLQYFARVEGATGDVFGMGRFALATTFDANLVVTQDQIDRVARGHDDGLDSTEIDDVFRQGNQAPGGPNSGTGSDGSDDGNGSEGSAVPLVTSLGFAPGTHYTAVGSLDSSGGSELYQFSTPQGAPGQTFALTLTLAGLSESNPVTGQLTLLDSQQQPVHANILANGNGTYTIQVAKAPANTTYFVKVQSTTSSGTTTSSGGEDHSGYFALTILTAKQATPLQTFAQGKLTAAAPTQTYHLYVAQTQLFQFSLSAGSAASTSATVKLAIHDSADNIVFSLAAAAGETISAASLLLPPGTYTVRVAGTSVAGVLPILTYHLRGKSIGDHIGPVLSNTTQAPQFTSTSNPGQFVYPPSIVSTSPFLLHLVPPPKPHHPHVKKPPKKI